MRTVIQFLSIPLLFLNLIGWFVSGVWLAILGQWASIGYGLLSMMLSHFVLGFALMPILLLAIPMARSNTGPTAILECAAALLAGFYRIVVMTAWCGAVLYFFMERADAGSFVPSLIWSYAVAMTPWQYLASKDQQGGDQSSQVELFFAQFGFLVMILLACFTSLPLLSLLWPFASILVVGLVFHVIVAFQATRHHLPGGY